MNLAEKESGQADPATVHEALSRLVTIVSPFVPHLAEELWQALGHEGLVCHAPWPKVDAALLVDDRVTLPIQVNGKRRDEINVPKDMDAKQIEALALKTEGVQRTIGDATPKKLIIVPGRIINIII